MTALIPIATVLATVFLLPLGLQAQERGEGTSPSEVVTPNDAGVVSSVCGKSFGTLFNLEPRTDARAQFGQTVDFLPNRVAAGVDLVVGGATDSRFGSGYYVSRDADCAPEFEGSLPGGRGGPVVAADPTRNIFFMLTLPSPDVLHVFRSPAATLLNATACPAGTHTAAQTATCWPTQISLATLIVSPDKAHLAVDERTTGTGAGDVYIAYGERSIPPDIQVIKLVACTNTLSSCSAPLVLSGGDTDAHFAHVAVQPDGDVTLTWINVADVDPPTFQIKYRACTPAGAPTAPTCGATSLVHTETQALFGLLAAQDFDIATYPKHDHRVDANGTETYVVWDRCKVALLDGRICPDADVVMKASNNNGSTWSALTCVSCAAQDQFFPWIRTDRSRHIVNIAYLSSGGDATFHHRLAPFLVHINPGGATPDPVEPHQLVTLQNDPSGNPFHARAGFSDHVGVAARGTGVDGQSRAYIHSTFNNIQGTYNGVQAPEPNNHLSRFDY